MKFTLPLAAALSVLVVSTSFRKSDTVPLRRVAASGQAALKIPEPSDVTYDPETGHLFIVSDNGLLFETDGAGQVLRRAAEAGWDFEGVEVKGDYVYVSDESPRKVHRYDKKTLTRDHTYSVPYAGARNSGFESLAWNDTKGCFVLISEKNPVTIYELNEAFQVINEHPFRGARDIASARWYGGSMYLLSDEDETILKCDPRTYAVQETFKTKILNPEGLAFDRNGNAIIAADDLQRLYFFASFSQTHD